jgi:hypothetical protein
MQARYPLFVFNKDYQAITCLLRSLAFPAKPCMLLAAYVGGDFVHVGFCVTNHVSAWFVVITKRDRHLLMTAIKTNAHDFYTVRTPPFIF